MVFPCFPPICLLAGVALLRFGYMRVQACVSSLCCLQKGGLRTRFTIAILLDQVRRREPVNSPVFRLRPRHTRADPAPTLGSQRIAHGKLGIKLALTLALDNMLRADNRLEPAHVHLGVETLPAPTRMARRGTLVALLVFATRAASRCLFLFAVL